MRGKGGRTGSSGRYTGITPAYAGKSSAAAAARICAMDHPRACGEKRGFHLNTLASTGSPPRVRGKGSGKLHCSATMGITPAYAGKRTRPRRWVRPPRDHPRVCGEKSRWSREPGGCGGSPPRVRGKVCGLAALGTAPGITPAYAGKSGTAVLSDFGPKDHPRVCGEKPCGAGRWPGLAGSPPRMRGKALELFGGAVVDGITPACAGKSCPPQAPTFTRQDHPRVCGEKAPSSMVSYQP